MDLANLRDVSITGLIIDYLITINSCTASGSSPDSVFKRYPWGMTIGNGRWEAVTS